MDSVVWKMVHFMSHMLILDVQEHLDDQYLFIVQLQSKFQVNLGLQEQIIDY